MKKYLFNLKYIVLGTFVSLTACVSDDLANVGDLEDITGPTPFYNITNVVTSEFDCNDNELWANYDYNFQAGSNLAVNGTNYDWSVTPSVDILAMIDAGNLDPVKLVNKDLPILEQSIEAEKFIIIGEGDDAKSIFVSVIENEIAKLAFKIPCETDAAKIAVMQAQIVDLENEKAQVEADFTDETIQNITDLESQIDNLEAATLQDQELIFSFPVPGDYTIGLTVTDNLGKSNYTEKSITVNQAVPTIPVPEIGEPGFEDFSLFDGTGDGRDSWRSPSSSRWGSVFQINEAKNDKDKAAMPEGIQAAKFPADGSRTGYQEIEVTPGATYVLTYFSAFEETSLGDVTVAIVNTNANSLEDARLEANIIASRTDSNVGRVDNVFKKHAITFEAGENEKVIILLTNTGVESRLDAFAITVKQ